MLWLRVVHQGDERLDDLVSSSGRFPVLCADDGQTHLALLVDVGVIDAGFERDLGGFEWVLGGEDDFNPESAFVIGGIVRNDESLP